jgi:hypothetical protein
MGGDRQSLRRNTGVSARLGAWIFLGAGISWRMDRVFIVQATKGRLTMTFQVSRHRRLRLVEAAAMVMVGTVLAAPAGAQQVQWNEIAAPTGKEALSRTYPMVYRSDVIDVRVRGNGGEVEYMIQMKAGETVVYSWEVQSISDPQSFMTEFHGHTEPVGGRGDLMFYEKAAGAKANGSLIAPWEGTHGWYWQNKSAAPVVVRLRMAGFYELIPGQPGQAVKD